MDLINQSEIEVFKDLEKEEWREYRDPEFDDGMLICPVCGSNYLHQAQVRTIFRFREDGPGLQTIHTTDNRIETSFLEDKFIFGRRDVIYIYFNCEHCHVTKTGALDYHTLRIEQHKGLTLMQWVN